LLRRLLGWWPNLSDYSNKYLWNDVQEKRDATRFYDWPIFSLFLYARY